MRFSFVLPRQAGRKFIILRARTGTILCVDQHAADERIKLEELERKVWPFAYPRPIQVCRIQADFASLNIGEDVSRGEYITFELRSL